MAQDFEIPVIESCCTSVEEAARSSRSGADRIELCVDLDCGGLTPPVRAMRAAVLAVSVPVFVLVRPRAGDFVYSPIEFEAMKRSVEDARKAGAKGVVLGVLGADGGVDVFRTRQLVLEASGLEVTFHKAFDELRDLDQGFADCAAAGIHRILSSGGATTARAGASALRRLAASSGPLMMAGGGVRSDHVREMITDTGVVEVHARAEAIAPIAEALGVSPRAEP